MDVYQMRQIKVAPNLRERFTRFLTEQHHRAVVTRLRGFREELEAGMQPEPWTALEAPVVSILADICDALHLTLLEKAKVLGEEGQQTQDSILNEPVFKPEFPLNPRQQRALCTVQRQGQVTNGDMQQAFPQFTPETLRLDLADLVQRGLLRRHGRCRGTVYTAL